MHSLNYHASVMRDSLNHALGPRRGRGLLLVSTIATVLTTVLTYFMYELERRPVPYQERYVADRRLDAGAQAVGKKPIAEGSGLPAPGSETAYFASVGRIVHPSEGEVQPIFRAQGKVELAEGEVAWLVVRKKDLFWPKEPAIQQPGAWRRTVFEQGPSGAFHLVLIAVGPSTDQMFRDWFRDALTDRGFYPGLTLSEYRVLDEVSLRTR